MLCISRGHPPGWPRAKGVRRRAKVRVFVVTGKKAPCRYPLGDEPAIIVYRLV